VEGSIEITDGEGDVIDALGDHGFSPEEP